MLLIRANWVFKMILCFFTKIIKINTFDWLINWVKNKSLESLGRFLYNFYIIGWQEGFRRRSHVKLWRLSNCWSSELWRKRRDVWGKVTDGHFIILRLILEFYTKYKERSLKYFQHGRGIFWSTKWQDSSCCYVESGLDWIGGKAETRVMRLKQFPWEMRVFSANAVAVNVISVACIEGGRMLECLSWHHCFLGVARDSDGCFGWELSNFIMVPNYMGVVSQWRF